jgi:hypothetical protein
VTENRCPAAESLHSWLPAIHFKMRGRSSRAEVREALKWE